MRKIIHTIVFATIVSSDAFCNEQYSHEQSLLVASASYSKYSNFNTKQIRLYENGYKVARNNSIYNKYGRSATKATSPEGSVELIEMIKTAKSKKSAVKLKN